MKYEGVSFNKSDLEYPLEEFIYRFQHLWPKLSMKDRKERLVEVYQLLKKQNENAG
jgi:hypothetical protein